MKTRKRERRPASPAGRCAGPGNRETVNDEEAADVLPSVTLRMRTLAVDSLTSHESPPA